MNTVSKFNHLERGDVVVITPDEAKGDITHFKCQQGIVTGTDVNYVYVQLMLGGVLLRQEVTCTHDRVVKMTKTYALT